LKVAAVPAECYFAGTAVLPTVFLVVAKSGFAAEKFAVIFLLLCYNNDFLSILEEQFIKNG